MNKKIAFVIALIIIVIIGIVFWQKSQSENSAQALADYKNISYTIEGQRVSLVNGLSEQEAAPGSASKIVTRYFGNEVHHDLDGDGREDVAFLLTQEAGGSGTFYYLVAALNKEAGYVGSQALLLGDRIAPQTTEMGEGRGIVVNYADRAAGESFAVQPSVGKSLRVLLDPSILQFSEAGQI